MPRIRNPEDYMVAGNAGELSSEYNPEWTIGIPSIIKPVVNAFSPIKQVDTSQDQVVQALLQNVANQQRQKPSLTESIGSSFKYIPMAIAGVIVVWGAKTILLGGAGGAVAKRLIR